MTDPSNAFLIYKTVTIICVTISIVASVLIMYVIIDMKRFSGFLMLILAMSICQFIYDISLYTNTFNSDNEFQPAYVWSNFFQFIGGMTVDSINMILAVAVFYILKTSKNLRIKENFKWIMLITLTPAIVDCSLYLNFLSSPNHTDVIPSSGKHFTSFFYLYFVYRLMAVIVNLLFYGLGHYYGLKLFRGISGGLGMPNSTNSSLTNMLTLTKKFMYYPVVSAISRLGYLFYEISFGFDFNPSNTKENTARYILAVVSIALTPIAPIGYFVIFMTTQPNAETHLKHRFVELKHKLGFHSDIENPLIGKKYSTDSNQNDGNKFTKQTALEGNNWASSYETNDNDSFSPESHYESEFNNENISAIEFKESITS